MAKVIDPDESLAKMDKKSRSEFYRAVNPPLKKPINEDDMDIEIDDSSFWDSISKNTDKIVNEKWKPNNSAEKETL